MANAHLIYWQRAVYLPVVLLLLALFAVVVPFVALLMLGHAAVAAIRRAIKQRRAKGGNHG